MRVAVHDSRLTVRRYVGLQPLGEVGDRERLGIVAVVPIAFQQPQELRNLALHKGSRPLQLGERLVFPFGIAQPREARGVGRADVVPQGLVADVGLGHLAAGVEAVDLFHQVEDDPEHIQVFAAGDEARVRDVRARERAQRRDLSEHRLVARRPRMKGRAAQHHRAPVDVHPHHDVLRSAGERCDVGDIRAEPLLSDPPLQGGLVGLAQAGQGLRGIGHG